jgi:hypothetical protein
MPLMVLSEGLAAAAVAVAGGVSTDERGYNDTTRESIPEYADVSRTESKSDRNTSGTCCVVVVVVVDDLSFKEGHNPSDDGFAVVAATAAGGGCGDPCDARCLCISLRITVGSTAYSHRNCMISQY